MNIAFDMSFTQTHSNIRGIGQYNRNLIEAIQRLDNNNSYYFYYPNSQSTYLKEDLDTFLTKHSIDIFHITSPFDFIGNNHPKKRWFKNTRIVVTLFDLIPLLFPTMYLSETTARAYFETIEFIKSCDLILAISETTKKDAVAHSNFDPSKIKVIMGGVDDNFKVKKSLNLKLINSKYKIVQPYIMFSGGVEYRKNLKRFLEAFSKLSIANQYQIVIFNYLSPQEIEQLNRLSNELDINRNIVLTGYVPINDLIEIYNGADLFVFPSLYEGLGLPVLEAMACGVPVLTSNTSSLNEISGNAAYKVNPENVEEITRGLETILLNNPLKDSLRQQGLKHVTQYNWDNVGKDVLIAYQQIPEKNDEFFTLFDDREKKILGFFTQLYRLNNDQFLQHLYIEILNREPDQIGFNVHKRNLTRGVKRILLISSFLLSPEANHIFSRVNDYNETIGLKITNLLSSDNDTFIDKIYNEFLNREPSTTEKTINFNKLIHGTSKIHLLIDLLNSNEFQKIINPMNL
ncbi:glycosyltransferase [Cytobacillus praedii]|uniref:glycosyltransferase n=1 Tax=Cytobacillus praedii TaxID=1742358 RepID=UPI002E223ADE|nr:glycosyltransferase [Cytobacillus praedii]MED3552014.1 glycosyltransferase [Cytobacillus praedii]